MYTELNEFQNWLTCQYPLSSTKRHYISDLMLFFSYTSKPPGGITFHDIDRYANQWCAKDYSPLTINRRLSSIRTFYYFLSIINDGSVNCPVIVERHFLRKSHYLHRDASEEQIKIIFSYIDNPRDKAIFTLMLECGLRVGEVSNLLLDDLLLDIPLRLRIHGKGDKERIVYLSPPAIEALNSWLTSRPVTQTRAVFISKHGERLSVSGIQYLLQHYCEKADIHITCHQFRHAFGRRMAEARLPITSLQKLLGHRSPRTTQRYVHLSNPTLQSEYDHAIASVLESFS
jgi:site-specific recombinase XerD